LAAAQIFHALARGILSSVRVCQTNTITLCGKGIENKTTACTRWRLVKTLLISFLPQNLGRLILLVVAVSLPLGKRRNIILKLLGGTWPDGVKRINIATKP